MLVRASVSQLKCSIQRTMGSFVSTVLQLILTTHNHGFEVCEWLPDPDEQYVNQADTTSKDNSSAQ